MANLKHFYGQAMTKQWENYGQTMANLIQFHCHLWPNYGDVWPIDTAIL